MALNDVLLKSAGEADKRIKELTKQPDTWREEASKEKQEKEKLSDYYQFLFCLFPLATLILLNRIFSLRIYFFKNGASLNAIL